MNGRQFPIFPILIMCALAVGAYWVYKNIELIDFDYPVGQNDEARANRLLASMRLLEREGFSFNVAKNRSVFSSLDAEKSDVLWIADLNELSNEQESIDIYNWVESGGILLTSPLNAAAFAEHTVSGNFLSKIGIETFEELELELFLEQPDLIRNNEDGVYLLALPETGPIELPKFELYSANEPYFKSAFFEANNARTIVDSPYLIQKSIGDGYVTVYADGNMFDNDEVGSYDHAYLLLWLTQPADQKQVSIVFRPEEKPGLFQLLWSRFTLAIMLLGLVLIGFLRWASSRLGPVEHELPPIQNNLMAHLEARGEFWYRHKYTDKVLGKVQDAALENLLKRRGLSGPEQHSQMTDKTAIIKQARELLQCADATAENALFGKANNDHAILSASRALQKINHRKPFQP